MFSNLAEMYAYIKQNKIQNIDIRFSDEEYQAKSFSIMAEHFSSKLFNVAQFKFNNYILNPLNSGRCFNDPFLPHQTLVFLTNLVNQQVQLNKLKTEKLTASVLLDFYLNNTENITINNKPYATSPFDTARDLRCEIILALKEMSVDVVTHYAGNEALQNVIYIKCLNNFNLLDVIEKFKYAVLMVASVYNKEIDINKGIFVVQSLLASK